MAKGFGEGHVTGITAWLTYSANAIVTAMIAVSFGSYASAVFAEESTAWLKFFAVLIIVVMTAVNIVGAKLVANAQTLIASPRCHLTDAEVIDQLARLHVFGRVAPEDKLRLARLMQESGEVVAMTGDAVNDAAALKQADVGVAMGSGSEVSKQAAKIVLTDDNFATLVRAVDLGRDI